MKLDYMLQVTKVNNGSDTILRLKEVGINCEVFFNKLQQIKFNLDTNILLNLSTKRVWIISSILMGFLKKDPN